MSAWRAALRIARRDLWRTRARSLLVVLMIALPVAGVTWVDVLWRTHELTPDQQSTRQMGRADVVLTDSGLTRTDQFGDGSLNGDGVGEPSRPPGSGVDLAAGLPAGSSSLLDRSASGSITAGELTSVAGLRELAYDAPLARGLYAQVTGRAPRQAGEAALTEGLAERLSVGVGDRVRTGDVEVTVVGLVADGSRREVRTVLLPPGTLPPGTLPPDAEQRLLVDLSVPLTYQLAREWNARGVLAEGRTATIDGSPTTYQAPGADAQEVTALVLVAGMALLEVVLLAGPAFAVGARRSGRQLALLSATGAQRRDLRRTVLAGAVLLGAGGAVLGLVLGIGLAAVSLPLVQRNIDQVLGPFDARPLELFAVTAVGVAAALLAALLPALSASRQDVVAALTGRRGVVRGSRRTPVLGLVATAVGAGVALAGAQRQSVVVILAGSVLAELGLVATTPAIVGLAGRLGPYLPAAPRLALRDAARNRSRTAPAVSAVLAAVAGSVAIGTVVASIDRHDERNYTPAAQQGTAVLPSEGNGAQLPSAARALQETLPTREVVTVRAVRHQDALVELRRAEADRCPADVLPAGASPEDYERATADPRCAGRSVYDQSQLSGLLVGGGDTLRAVTGRTDPSLVRTLEQGGVLVGDPVLVGDDGRVRMVIGRSGGTEREVRVPAAVLPDLPPSRTILSPQTARTHGLPVTAAGVVAVLDRTPTDREQDRAQGALDRLGLEQELYVERGYQSGFAFGLLALVVGSAVLVLGASGIATGLAAEDGRADLSTLAAIGATPGLRRVLAGAQSAVTAGLGTALGVVAGLVPGIGLLLALNSTMRAREGFLPAQLYPVVLPWQNLLVTALVVPLLAAAVAMALTRSRLPLLRRQA